MLEGFERMFGEEMVMITGREGATKSFLQQTKQLVQPLQTVLLLLPLCKRFFFFIVSFFVVAFVLS